MEKIQKDVVKWYHTYLLHCGLYLTEVLIFQHLYGPGIIEEVQKEVRNRDTCQHVKRSTKNGKLPAKLAEEIPYDNLCVDLIGPYAVRVSCGYYI